MARWLQSRVSYFATIAMLLGILKVGHMTHWTLHWPESESESSSHKAVAKASAKDKATDEATQAATAGKPEASDAAAELPLTEVALTERQLERSGIELHRVDRQPMRQTLAVHGVVSYNKNLVAQLSSRVPGTVWRVEKQVGQRIRKGDLLAIVEAIDVGRVKAELAHAAVTAELKRATIERFKAAGSAVPEKLLREAEVEERQARIAVHNAVQTLVNLGLPIAVEDLNGLDDQQLIRKLQFLGIPPAVADKLDPRTTTANLLPLIAPFDGVVIGREISLGETVTPQDAHFEIADISRMWVELEVRKEDASQVRLGQQIKFRADGLPGEVLGTVSWISTEVNENTRTLRVRSEVENPVVDDHVGAEAEQRLLRANTFGTGIVIVRETPDAVVVPNEALQRSADQVFVFERVDGKFIQRMVQPGIVTQEFTEILSGVESGAMIAAAGSHLVKSELYLASLK